MGSAAEYAREIFLLLIGIVTGAVATRFMATLFQSKDYKARFDQLDRSRNEAVLSVLKDHELTDEQKALAEVRINRDFARQLELLDLEFTGTNRSLLYIAAIGGLFGMIVAFVRYFDVFKTLIQRLISSPAAAAAVASESASRSDLAPFIPYLVMVIIVVLSVSFLAALWVVLTTEENKANAARIKAAADIVKTFGGFFTGLATTLFH
ncbi:hypothetical protein [Bradyrhizobium sp. SZCCHNPS1003]|uniref:hypothetical protein n=1 Tax=Bradyrhizobium sp. SZCCHNPS1003 TaxID=3057330 RepID=UPI0028E4BEB2|nr:hypothetical protein [Bradyrhizobium sp. SZCCHNPS1003]